MPGARAPAIRKLIVAIRWAFVAAWIPFVAWLLIYAMPLSALHAALGAWAIAPTARGKRVKIAVLAAAILTVPLIGLPEYAATTRRFHCRVYGFFELAEPRFCEREDVTAGSMRARRNEPLFSGRERLAIHGFNFLLAGGGWAAGFPEVARETLMLSFASDRIGVQTSPLRARRGRCSANTLQAIDEYAFDSDFPMRSAAVRRAIAGAIEELERSGGREKLTPINWVSGKNNNEGYARALARDSLRVALALEVPHSTLETVLIENHRARITWSGPIYYPPNASFSFPWGSSTVLVSESIFCGMQADGAMNPYALKYRWTIDRRDPRLSPEGREQTERGLVESLLRTLL